MVSPSLFFFLRSLAALIPLPKLQRQAIWIGTHEINSRAYCGLFNFRGADQQQQVRDLSGGERNRVQLAKLLAQPSNVLILDEPTNDLDIETLELLEERASGTVGVPTGFADFDASLEVAVPG